MNAICTHAGVVCREDCPWCRISGLERALEAERKRAADLETQLALTLSSRNWNKTQLDKALSDLAEAQHELDSDRWMRTSSRIYCHIDRADLEAGVRPCTCYKCVADAKRAKESK